MLDRWASSRFVISMNEGGGTKAVKLVARFKDEFVVAAIKAEKQLRESPCPVQQDSPKALLQNVLDRVPLPGFVEETLRLVVKHEEEKDTLQSLVLRSDGLVQALNRAALMEGGVDR